MKPRSGVIAAVVAIVVTACTATQNPSADQTPRADETSAATEPAAPSDGTSAQAGGTLVVALPGDLQHSEPAFATDSNSDFVFRQVMESLVNLDATGTEVVPGLAASWDVSPDGLTYTFTLQSGVTFHDGTEFNAEAVKFNLDRWAAMPEETQALTSRYPRIFGGFGDASIVESVEAVEPTILEVNLKEPRSNFLTTLFMSSFTISSPAALIEGDADNPDLTANAYANGAGPSMVGTGPFVFSEWVRGDHITLTRNEDYWGEPALLDSVTIRPYPDETSALNALQSGDVDFLLQASPTSLATIESDASLLVLERGDPCNTFSINMNHTHPPMDNKDIRLAIGYALNTESYIEAFYAGQAVVADNYIPPWMPYYMPLDTPKYDPDLAREHIERSGVESPTLEFWYPSDVTRAYMPDPQGLFEAISRDLEAVGFTIEPMTSGWTTGYLSDRSDGVLPMWLFGNFCPWPSIDGMLNFAFFGGDLETGVRTENGYGTPEFQQAIRDGLTAPDEESARAAWEEVQQTLQEDYPMVPILHALTPGAIRSDVQGLVPSGWGEYLNTVWLDR